MMSFARKGKMMSFARNAKLQILNKPFENDCCQLAFFSGLLHISGEFDPKNYIMSFVTDIKEIYDFCNKIINQLYGGYAELEIEDDIKINKTRYYRIILPKERTVEMLRDFGLMNSCGVYMPTKIDYNIFQGNCCKRSFIKGVFVACATSNIKISNVKSEKSSNGYQVEFVSHSHEFLLEFSNLLAEFDLMPKLVKRKNHYVLYIKESNQVSDLLALVEAYDSVIQLQDELALRELRNNVNRQTNCVSANITKMVDASIKQINAIQTISDTIGLEKLPMELQEVALLRLANPEESLSDLLKLSNLPLSKSSLNYRMSKLIKIANTL